MSERGWLVASLVFVLACFQEVVFSGQAFVGMDHAIEFLPTWSFQRASLLAGELPLWDPRAGAGTPLLGAVYGGALDPVRWAFFPLPAVYGYGLHVVFCHLLAAAGTFRLARRVGARPWAAAFAAISLGAGGPFRSLGGFHAALASAAWLPWIIELALAFHAAPSLRRAVLAGVLVALTFHGGLPEYALGGAVIFASAAIAAGPRAILLSLVTGAVALLLTVGTLLPALELARVSTRRSGVAWSQIADHATQPVELATLLFPGFLGNTAHAPWTLGRVAFAQSYFLPVLYQGALAVLLVFFAPLRRSGAARALAALLVLSLLFALGEKGGLFTLLLTAVPPLRVFRYAYKAWAFAAPALAVLAALGLDEVARAPRRASLLGAFVLLGGLAVVAGGALLLFAPERVRLGQWLAGAAVPSAVAVAVDGLVPAAQALVARGVVLACVAIGLAGAATARTERTRTRRLHALALFALLDLGVVAHRATALVPRDLYAMRPELAAALDGVPPARFYLGESHDVLPPRFERDAGREYWEYQRERLRANLATFYGVHQLGNYNPGRLAWLNVLYLAIESAPPERRARLIATSGAEFVLSRDLLDHPRLELAAATSMRPVQRLYRVKDALPRYQLVREAAVHPTHGAALASLARGEARPDRAVLLRADRALTEPEDWAPVASEPDVLVTIAPVGSARERLAPALEPGVAAKVVSLSARRVELELPPSAPGEEPRWLVARDAFEPRWRATVDGAPAKVERANFAFRAVALPAGAKRVVFEYDASLARGAFAVQMGAWVAVLGVLAWRRRA